MNYLIKIHHLTNNIGYYGKNYLNLNFATWAKGDQNGKLKFTPQLFS